MLDADTKRRIDTARDILVGKVPDPKSQVEQITIALIYKFMDDMDAESEEFGGKRNFFAGEFARYGWAKLMRTGLGGYETLNLYAEAITKMPENPGIPLLFRDIFKNAYLPYRDPETLKMFLKVIDEFTYDHSERLGDAFEYLLSVLGSQGDAGQFRTPRHIIDFMVKIIDPQKDEVVLDPACGTAGFLISSYKHILRANTDEKGNSTLTPDDKGRLAQHFRGYDISPDMVRLSLVNLYLHGFADPHIYEYDTLSSQERWNETADVILANPPFMSPKGGIQPHNRFSVQSKRSEVLFVDYMAEHLTPNGRAGIIVPEGVIFQSGKAYVQLRRMLVESALVAVISLPAGVFNPYSGVKTSILILDKALAKKASTVAFFKVESDGFGLGAQRREIEQNDLPQVLLEMQEYLQKLRAGETVKELQPGLGLMVAREKLAANGEYNLSGERYRESVNQLSTYKWISLGEITTGQPQYGSVASKISYDGRVRYIRITDINDRGDLKTEDIVSPSIIEQDKFLAIGDILIARSGSVGRSYIHRESIGLFQFAGYLIRFCIDTKKALPEFVFYITQSRPWFEWIQNNSKTGTLSNINAKQYSSFSFPLPPLDVQKEIVAEIESCQKVIDGARAVVENYKPRIAIDPDWPMVELGVVCEIRTGKLNSNAAVKGGKYPFFTCSKEIFQIDNFAFDCEAILLSGNNANGDFDVKYFNGKFNAYQRTYVISIKDEYKNIMTYGVLQNILQANLQNLKRKSIGGLTKYLTLGMITSIKLPKIPIETQKTINSEIEKEELLVESNRQLITRFEEKIQMVLDRLWGKQEKDQE